MGLEAIATLGIVQLGALVVLLACFGFYAVVLVGEFWHGRLRVPPAVRGEPRFLDGRRRR
jgi:hypothetical protein